MTQHTKATITTLLEIVKKIIHMKIQKLSILLIKYIGNLKNHYTRKKVEKEKDSGNESIMRRIDSPLSTKTCHK